MTDTKYVTVPREPTREMLIAANAAWFIPDPSPFNKGDEARRAIYKAMLAAAPPAASVRAKEVTNLEIATAFHEAYERLAPRYGYETRPESRKPFSDLPNELKLLMVAVVREVRTLLAPAVDAPTANEVAYLREHHHICETEIGLAKLALKADQISAAQYHLDTASRKIEAATVKYCPNTAKLMGLAPAVDERAASSEPEMCPNCVTPWKCNGPHEFPQAASSEAAVAFDAERFERAPCYLCGYNGRGYYQPETHPCAAKYHAHPAPTTADAGVTEATLLVRFWRNRYISELTLRIRNRGVNLEVAIAEAEHVANEAERALKAALARAGGK